MYVIYFDVCILQDWCTDLKWFCILSHVNSSRSSWWKSSQDWDPVSCGLSWLNTTHHNQTADQKGSHATGTRGGEQNQGKLQHFWCNWHIIRGRQNYGVKCYDLPATDIEAVTRLMFSIKQHLRFSCNRHERHPTELGMKHKGYLQQA